MDKFDLVIIGSGMGGLVCGNLLALEGYKVCIIEKNKQIGGSLQTYVRDKVIFDSGVHYLGGLSKGQNLYQIFQYLGIIPHLKLQQLDLDVFDRVYIGDDETAYDFAQGYENFIARLLEHFPREEAALIAYCDKIKEICSKFPLYNLLPPDENNAKASVLEIDTKGYIDSITENKKLREVLAGNNALYAGEAGKTPLYVHALIVNSYIESSWKCIDGGSQIAKYISRNILHMGGTILRKTSVVKIAEENGVVTHVEVNDGRKIYADHFISNIHPVQTLEITETDLIKKAYRNRLKSIQNTISSFTINIVFKKDSFPYFKHNYYCCKEGSVWTTADYNEDNWPLGYAVFVGASSRSPEFSEGMSILSYMKYEEVSEWADSFNTVLDEEERGTAYNEFKNRKAERLLDEVEKRFPGLRSKIRSYYTATPLSYRDYIGNSDGSLYGISKDYRDPLKTFISPRTKLPNLYFTGQNLNLHGILGSAMSAIVTTNALLGHDHIIEKIRNA